MKKKSWTEKLNNSKNLPQVKKIVGKLSSRWGTGTVVIPAPREVDRLMNQIPRGKLTTINHLRQILAQKHHATIGCPLTTGIFAWIAAHAAEEQRAKKSKNITPWWRTLKSGGQLNPKYPGGVARQQKLLQAEGHHIIQKGQRFLVANYQEYLANF